MYVAASLIRTDLYGFAEQAVALQKIPAQGRNLPGREHTLRGNFRVRTTNLNGHLISNAEFQVVNRADAAFADLPWIEFRRHTHAVLGFDVQGVRKISPAGEQFRALRRVVNLDQ